MKCIGEERVFLYARRISYTLNSSVLMTLILVLSMSLDPCRTGEDLSVTLYPCLLARSLVCLFPVFWHSSHTVVAYASHQLSKQRECRKTGGTFCVHKSSLSLSCCLSVRSSHAKTSPLMKSLGEISKQKKVYRKNTQHHYGVSATKIIVK